MEISETFRILYNLIRDMAESPDGISSAEVVAKYNIAPRTFTKYREILEDAGIPLYSDKKRWYLTEGFQIPLTFSKVESELLALSLDSYRAQEMGHWKATRVLLQKLEPRFTDQINEHLIERFRLNHVAEGGASEKVFEQLVEAKRSCHEVWIDYQPLKQDRPWCGLVRPLAFVRNPYGDGTYLVGYAVNGEQVLGLRTLKLGRILNVRPTHTPFECISANQLAEVLNQAWGVWHQADRYEVVELLFDAKHQRRLSESRFHFSQELEVQADGRVLFRIQVSHWKEVMPWIRSWGADVVVINPPSLRHAIIAELHRHLQRYPAPVAESVPNALEVTWAKYDRATGQHHLLGYHLLDVAGVAVCMWENVLSGSQKRWLCQLLTLSETEAKHFVALLIGLHDIGKASSDFQAKVPSLFQRLLAIGFEDNRTPSKDIPHGVYSRNTLRHFLQERCGVEDDAARAIASGIGGHHGQWIAHDKRPRDPIQGKWRALQQEIIEQLLSVLPITTPPTIPEEQVNLLVVFLSGLTSVCDWIGSSEDYFPYRSLLRDAPSYWGEAREQAQYALSDLGWYGWRAPHDQSDFESMFGFLPNALQQTAIDYVTAHQHALPELIMIESATGGGKTEAALYLADFYLNALDLAGLYVAMPTQATSNQMFGRVASYLTARYPHQSINLQLIHAQATHHPLYKTLQAQDDRERQGNEDGLVAEAWFQHRKRTLLSSMAVGTIDQAMLGVLQTHHHFVRQFALSHKVVVFDEIHAYDTYMSSIINRLCQWLRAMHSPTIMLSATLPQQVKRDLLESFGSSADELPTVPYPRITCVRAGVVEVLPLPRTETRHIQIQYVGHSLDEWGWAVEQVYQAGGNVAIVCNTVNESIAVARAFYQHPDIAPEDVWLFHARFPPIWRKEIEQTIVDRFGKNGQRPTRSIVIATQIIEQSLDLDFDLLVSSVAPIDLLIQRLGRVHRHARHRPSHCAVPTIWIRQPMLEEGDVPAFGADEWVYERFILLRTWAVIRHKNEMRLPNEIDTLIESVYSGEVLPDLSPEYTHALARAQADYQRNKDKDHYQGGIHQLDAPYHEGLVGGSDANSSDDLEEIRFSVATRNILEGIDLICLHELKGGVSLDNQHDLRLDLNDYPTSEVQQALQQNRVAVRSQQVCRILKQELQLPESWKRHRALRHAYPVVFKKGEYRSKDGHLRLVISRQYGLEIILNKGDANDTIL